jgi:hypothetical protein
MAFITKDDLKAELTITGTSDDALLTLMSASVLSLWDTLTDKVWANSSYFEYHNPKGKNVLFLKNYPVTDISRIAYGTNNAINIRNTNSGTRATAAITSTGLVLTLDGIQDVTIVFVTYTTMTLVVTAINALGNGWEAKISNSTYTNWKSTELLVRFGLSCINNTWVYLEVPNEYLYDYQIDANGGFISNLFNLPTDLNSVIVNYTAGYSDTDVPIWLKAILIRQGCHWFMQARERRWHVSSVNFGEGGTISYNKLVDNLLPEFKTLAGKHNKIHV